MRNSFIILTLILILLFPFHLFGQDFTERVRDFISVDTSRVAITNCALIDGTGTSIQSNQTIIFSKNSIEFIGESDSVTIPENTMVINGSGKTVIPGFVMLHEHMFYTKFFEDWFSVGQMTFTFPRLYLAGGVTSMRTAGSIQPQSDLNVKKWIEEGKMIGPKMHITSPFIEREGYDIAEMQFIKSSAEVAETVNYWAERGVTSFKVYNHITKEDLKTCVTEAHKRGLKVTGHLCSLTYEEASNIGIDNLEHGFMVSSDFVNDKQEEFCDPFTARKALAEEDENSEKANALIDLLIKNKTVITTTPNVFEPYTGHELIPGGGEDALAPQIMADVKAIYDRYQNKDSAAVALFNKNLKWLKRFYDQGGFLVAGTDPTGAGRTVAGYSNMRTLEILVESGFPLLDAIKICTKNGANFLEQNDVGTLEVGKKADLLVIDGDLKENIRNIRKTEIVFKDGVGYNPKKLFESVKGKVGLN